MTSERLESKFRTDVKKMSDEELGVELKRLQDELFTLRSQAVTEKVENVSRFGIARRNIARVQTERNARLAKNSGASAGKPRAPKAARAKAAGAKAGGSKAGAGAKKAAGGAKKTAKTTKKTSKKTTSKASA